MNGERVRAGIVVFFFFSLLLCFAMGNLGIGE